MVYLINVNFFTPLIRRVEKNGKVKKWKKIYRHPGQGHAQWTNELCHDSKQRRGLENTKDIQQRNLKRRNQKLVSS